MKKHFMFTSMSTHRKFILTGLAAVVVFLLTLLIWRQANAPTRDKNGILLFENLHQDYESRMGWGDDILTWFIPKTKYSGPYMYLGKHRYTGTIINYYKDNTAHFKGEYTDGTASGTWLCYYHSGNVARQINYDEPGNIITANEYFGSGQLRSHFQRGDIGDTAAFVRYFNDGSVQYSIRNTKSPVVNYFEPGNEDELPSFTETFTYTKRPAELVVANNKKQVYEYFNSDSVFYLKDNNTLNLLELQHLQNNRAEGECYLYYRNGHLMKQQGFTNNEPNGDFVCYYSNGKMRVNGNYKNGQKTGVWRDYFPTGKLKILSTFTNGVLNGDYAEYNAGGKIIEKGKYRNGEKAGNWLLKGDTQE